MGRAERHAMLTAIVDPARIAPVTTTELSAVTGLSEWTIRRDIALGALPAHRRPGRTRVRYHIDIDAARAYLRTILGSRYPSAA